MSKTRKNYYPTKFQEKSIKNRSFVELSTEKATKMKNKISIGKQKNDIKRETSSEFSMKR